MRIERLQEMAEVFSPEYRKKMAQLDDEHWTILEVNTIALYTEAEVMRVLTMIDDSIVKEKDEHTAEVLAETALHIAKETGNIKSIQFDLATITPKDYVADLRSWRAQVNKELS